MKEYHTIKWEDVEVMNHSQRYQQRYTVEAWHIRSEQHEMNRDESFFHQYLLATHYTHAHPTDFRTVPLHSIPTSTDSNGKLCMPKLYPFLLAAFCLRPISFVHTITIFFYIFFPLFNSMKSTISVCKCQFY